MGMGLVTMGIIGMEQTGLGTGAIVLGNTGLGL